MKVLDRFNQTRIYFKIFLMGFICFLSAVGAQGFAAADYTAGGISFDVPASWQKVEPSSKMRLYQFQVTSEGVSDPAELSVFYFGAGQGGDVQGNLERWKAQFHPMDHTIEPEINEQTVGDMKVTTIYLEGTYQSGMMAMGDSVPKENYGLLGAIGEGPEGPVFFKMTGPREVIRANKAAFAELTGSFKNVSLSQ